MYYVSQFQARKELAERQGLKREVEAWWAERGIVFPTLPDRPAVMGRHVPTFRFEDAVFTLMAEAAGLDPTWLGYAGDKFVSGSNVKRALVHPMMTERFNKHNKPITTRRRLVRIPDECNGKRLADVMTDDGQRLVDWHEARLLTAVPHAFISDMSHILADWGGRADRYYDAYLSFFLGHAVLFEDYHGGESGAALDGFTARVFEPAVARLEERFGVKPLVVPLPWWEELALYPDGEWLTDWRGIDTLLQKKMAA